jgi:hypothetical protein
MYLSIGVALITGLGVLAQKNLLSKTETANPLSKTQSFSHPLKYC